MVDVDPSPSTLRDPQTIPPVLSPPTSSISSLKPVVAIIDHTATLGGGEIALLNLVKHLDTQRFTPIVVLSADGPLVGRLEEAGVCVHVLPLSPSVLHVRKDSLGMGSLTRIKDMFRMVLYIGKMARFLRSQGVALVHTNSLKADILGGLAGRWAHLPVIWHIRDRIENDYLPMPVVTVFRILCRMIPTYVVANSRATLLTLFLPSKKRRSATYVYNGLRPRSNARIVHDGVPLRPQEMLDSRLADGRLEPVLPADAEFITADTPVSDELVSKRGPVIGLVGRISPWKGQHIFLQAARLVYSRYPEARFQIIGAALFSETEYEAEVRALAETLGLSECVEFAGFCADVTERIAGLDILVHASTVGEPFGLVIIEGMVAGKPVVATNGGGVPEIIEDGISGLLVPMSDVEAMAAAILCLLDRPELAAEIGKQGFNRVASHFTIELTARRVEAVYSELLGLPEPD